MTAKYESQTTVCVWPEIHIASGLGQFAQANNSVLDFWRQLGAGLKANGGHFKQLLTKASISFGAEDGHVK